jgi:FixJ family two-component response regulator
MSENADEIKIVLERIRLMPRTIQLNIGTFGSFTRDKLLDEIENKTEVGCLVTDMYMAYLRSFKEDVK